VEVAVSDDVYAKRVAGLDISKRDVKVCVRVEDPGGRIEQLKVRTFATTTPGVLALRDYLDQHGVELVAMESTGVFWKPLFYVLEDAFRCWLLNPVQVKRVPGRKTDVTDAQWIARLAQYGMVQPSFVPAVPVRALRDLTRYRTSVVRDRARVVQRLQDLLEDAGIKLSAMISDITGVSGRAMIDALINEPDADPARVADLAQRRMRTKIPVLTEALTGHFTHHHAVLAGIMLRQIHDLDQVLVDLTGQIDTELAPFATAAARLTTIPGIGERAAAIIIAETGADMSRFPTPHNLVSWAGLCPGNNESAGRHLSTRTRKGNPALRGLLFEAASAAARTNDTYLSAKYADLAARRGRTRALVAISRIILETCWHVLTTDTDYHDLTPTHVDRHRRNTTQRRLRHARHDLEAHGYTITEPAA